MSKDTPLILNIESSSDDDVEKLAELTQQLREEIYELDVEKVDLIKSKEELPKGAKAGDVVAWGSLLVTLAASSGVFPALINTLQSWLTRHERSKIIIEEDGDKFEVTGNPSQEQQQMFYAWISRHSQKENTND